MKLLYIQMAPQAVTLVQEAMGQYSSRENTGSKSQQDTALLQITGWNLWQSLQGWNL